MRYNEFREKIASDFIEFTNSGITRDEIDSCCHLFGILVACLSAPVNIKDEDLLKMFIKGYATAKENSPVDEVITITIPKKST